MHMRWSPGVGMIAPRICARPDRHKTVAPFRIRKRMTSARKIPIEWRMVLINRMEIAACRIRLPDFEQRIWQRTSCLIEHVAAYNNAFAQGFARLLMCQISASLAHNFRREHGTGHL